MCFSRKFKRSLKNKQEAYKPGTLGVSEVVIEKRKNPDSKFYNGPLKKVIWYMEVDKKGRLKTKFRVAEA